MMPSGRDRVLLFLRPETRKSPRTCLVPRAAALKLGRILIDFDERATALAQATAALKKNREDYDALKKKMNELDAEYEQITSRIAQEVTYAPLLAARQKNHPVQS